MNQLARFIKEVGDSIYARDRWRARSAEHALLADLCRTGWQRLNEHPVLAIPLALCLGGIIYVVAKNAVETSEPGAPPDAE